MSDIESMVWSQLAVPGDAPRLGGLEGVDANGQKRSFHLSDYKGSYLVVVFYPGDWESKDLLKAFSFLTAHFEARGVQLVGVSTDSVSSHESWVKAGREEDGWGGWSGLHLWSDQSGALATQYDLFDEEEGVCQEGVVLIDREGRVRHAMSTSLGYDETAESALEVVNMLQGCDIHGVDRLGREKTFQLADYRGSFLVVILYSDDWEAFDLLDAFSKLAPKFRKQGVQLAGCSGNSASAHACWIHADKNEGGWSGDAGFALWSDPTGLQLAQMFGLWDAEEGCCLPGVAVVDRQGELVHIVTSSMDFSDLAEDTLRLVTALTNADLSERMPQRSKPEETRIPTTQEVREIKEEFVDVPQPETRTKVTDWSLKKVTPVERIVAEQMNRPPPPRMVYCPRNPVFDLIPARIRRIVNPKASLLSCSASLQRNFIGYDTTNPDQRLKLANAMEKIFGSNEMPEDLAGSFTHLAGGLDEGKLMENPVFTLSGDVGRTFNQSSKGKGLFINQHGNLVAWIGQGDGLRLVSAAHGQDIKYVLLRLQKAITRVEQGMKELGMEGFQTEAGGFVHDKPGVGTTGFQVRFVLALPGIARTGKAEVEKIGEELGLQVEQVSGGGFSVVLKQKHEDREDDIVTRSVVGVDRLWRLEQEVQSKLGVRLAL